jgi:hypothetical protein
MINVVMAMTDATTTGDVMSSSRRTDLTSATYLLHRRHDCWRLEDQHEQEEVPQGQA